MPSPQPSDRVSHAIQTLTMLASLSPTVEVSDLAERLGWDRDQLAVILKSLERSGMVDLWLDPDRPGSKRVMLSHQALRRIGLTLSPSGDRWNPARFPSEPIRLRAPRRPRQSRSRGA